MKEVFKEVETHMKHALDHFHHELKHLRTGRASLSLLDGLTVDYYGSPVPLNQVANLSVPDATMIVAQPYDPSQSSAIERAIMKSDLGLNPSADGKIIRIPVPPLTEERRKEYVKLAGKYAEQQKIAVRNVRRDANDRLKKMLKDKTISEDAERDALQEIQKLTDGFIGKIDELTRTKEQEILSV